MQLDKQLCLKLRIQGDMEESRRHMKKVVSSQLPAGVLRAQIFALGYVGCFMLTSNSAS